LGDINADKTHFHDPSLHMRARHAALATVRVSRKIGGRGAWLGYALLCARVQRALDRRSAPQLNANAQNTDTRVQSDGDVRWMVGSSPTMTKRKVRFPEHPNSAQKKTGGSQQIPGRRRIARAAGPVRRVEGGVYAAFGERLVLAATLASISLSKATLRTWVRCRPISSSMRSSSDISSE